MEGDPRSFRDRRTARARRRRHRRRLHGASACWGGRTRTVEHSACSARSTSSPGRSKAPAAPPVAVAASEEVCDVSPAPRPQLFSNAAADRRVQRAAIDRVMLERPELLARLRENAQAFRGRSPRRLRPLDGGAAIVPIIIGETADAISLSAQLLEEGVSSRARSRSCPRLARVRASDVGRARAGAPRARNRRVGACERHSPRRERQAGVDPPRSNPQAWQSTSSGWACSWRASSLIGRRRGLIVGVICLIGGVGAVHDLAAQTAHNRLAAPRIEEAPPAGEEHVLRAPPTGHPKRGRGTSRNRRKMRPWKTGPSTS